MPSWHILISMSTCQEGTGLTCPTCLPTCHRDSLSLIMKGECWLLPYIVPLILLVTRDSSIRKLRITTLYPLGTCFLLMLNFIFCLLVQFAGCGCFSIDCLVSHSIKSSEITTTTIIITTTTTTTTTQLINTIDRVVPGALWWFYFQV